MKFFVFLIFLSGASGIFITCDFYYTSWDLIGDTYVCEVTSADFSDNSTHITGYNGTHLSGNSSFDVGIVEFNCDYYSLNFTTIPKGFLEIFPNKKGLFFESCPINVLNGDELDEYPNLKFFAIYYSNLTRVPGNLFNKTPDLVFVYFALNQIQHVGNGLLDHLQNLQEAYFFGNICISKIASNPSEIPALIEALRQNCPDIETTPTISTSPSPPTTLYNYNDNNLNDNNSTTKM